MYKLDIKDVKLLDFLMLFARNDSDMAIFNILNTNNESFPEKYRYNSISAGSLFVELYKGVDDCNKDLLNRNIDFICILPTTSKITDTKFDIPIYCSDKNGFYTTKIDAETGEEYDSPIGFVLHIVLKTD